MILSNKNSSILTQSLCQRRNKKKLKWFGVQTNRSRNVKFISPNLKGRQCHVDFVLRKQGMTHLEYLRGSCFLFSRWYFNNSNSFIGYKLVVTRLIWKHPHLTRALVLLITIESRLYFLQKTPLSLVKSRLALGLPSCSCVRHHTKNGPDPGSNFVSKSYEYLFDVFSCFAVHNIYEPSYWQFVENVGNIERGR